MKTVLARVTGSSLGVKYLLAISGIGLFGFLVAHLAGNLLIYKGPEALNAYGQGLADLGPGLWVLRIGLFVVFLIHLGCAIKLTRENRAARPEAYQCKKAVAATYASRTMVVSGLLVLLYLFFHLAHFTFHKIGDIGHHVDDVGRHDVYQMMLLGFQDSLTSLIYILAMIILGSHLSHGLQSLLQSLGLSHPLYTPSLRRASLVLGWGLALAFISIPVSVWLGVVR